MHRSSQARLRHPRRSRLPWIGALLSEAGRSDLVVSISKRNNRRRREGGRKWMVRLLLIILGAIVVIVLGLYGGLASSHYD